MAEWTVRLTGDAADLLRMADAFSSGEMRVTVDGGAYFLRAAEFDALHDADAIRIRAEAVVARANGIVKVFAPEHRNVAFGGVRRENGDVHEWRWVTDSMHMSDSVAVTVTRADGTVEHAHTAQRLDAEARIAARDANVADAVELFARATTWDDLYRVYEVVRQGLGGQSGVERLVGRVRRTRFTNTADQYRHAVPRGVPPKRPMAWDEAELFIGELLRTLIDRAR